MSAGVRSVAVLTVVLAAVACLDDSIGGPRALEVSVAPRDSVVARGDSVVVDLTARGDDLMNVTLAWGDGDDESFSPQGGESLEVRTAHLYQEEGVYGIEAVAEEALGGTAAATAEVRVTGPNSS